MDASRPDNTCPDHGLNRAQRMRAKNANKSKTSTSITFENCIFIVNKFQIWSETEIRARDGRWSQNNEINVLSEACVGGGFFNMQIVKLTPTHQKLNPAYRPHRRL